MSLDKTAQSIIKTLKTHGYQAYYVGGCVRDRLLGLDSSDIDIATSAPSNIVQAIFKKTIPVGIKFGIIVVVENGYNFEVATFRKDKDYIDGRHPENIEQATLEEDVQRRDFTINGLYFDPLEEKLLDFVEGKKDLQNKLIKAIGDPLKRFEEDHLRMIRACRYAASLGFCIESKTKQAIIKMAPLCHEGISIERIIQELEKMHSKGVLKQGLELMDELFLLKSIFPSLHNEIDSSLKKRFEKIGALKKDSCLIFPLSILFDLKSQYQAQQLCLSFKLSNESLKMSLHLIQMQNYKVLQNIDLAKLLSLPYFEQIQDVQACYEDDKSLFIEFIQTKKEELAPVIRCLINKTPIITASDLEIFKIPKGPLYKKLLDEAMGYYADHPQFSKQQILNHLHSLIPQE